MITSFNWIIKDKLAGSGKPGLYGEMDDDVRFLKENNFTTIVTLTEDEMNDDFKEHSFEVIHYPIPDMGVPAMPRFAHGICLDLKNKIDEGGTVLLHCKAGLGRTGTILACVLVEFGYAPDKAITEVRSRIKGAIQNELQEGFIHNYHQYHLKVKGY